MTTRNSIDVTTKATFQVSAARPGFSLLEIMLVVAILGILMGAVAWNLAGSAAKARVSTTKITMRTLKGALTTYSVEQSAYPPTLQPLVLQKVIEEKSVKDGWGRDYYYSPQGLNGNPFMLISLGEDGQPGTADDIDVWTLDK